MIQPTASKTNLLLQCARPFSADSYEEDYTPEPPGESARYGSAFHAVMAGASPEEACTRYGCTVAPAEVAAHADRVRAMLQEWLNGDNPYSITWEVREQETSRALSIGSAEVGWYQQSSRATTLEENMHIYELRDGEIGGTVDMVLDDAPREGRTAVLDFKTGDYMPPIDSMGQLHTLALMWQAQYIVVIHAPRSAPVTIHTAPARDISAELYAAMQRIDDGSMRPGPECQFCPARKSCPIFFADTIKECNSLLRVASGAAPLADPTDPGALHLFLERLEPLKKRAKEIIRARVQSGEPIVRPDGRSLRMAPYNMRTLSMASIKRKLGAVEGDRLIAELDARGVIETHSGEKLVAK